MARKRSFWEIEDDEEAAMPAHSNVESSPPDRLALPLTWCTAVPHLQDLTDGLTLGPQTWALVLRRLLKTGKQTRKLRVATSCTGTGSPVLALKAMALCHLGSLENLVASPQGRPL